MDAYKAHLDACDPDAEQALRDLPEHLQLNPQLPLAAAEAVPAWLTAPTAQPGMKLSGVCISESAMHAGADEQWLTDCAIGASPVP